MGIEAFQVKAFVPREMDCSSIPGRQMLKLRSSDKAAVKAAITESEAVRESRCVLFSSPAKRSQYAVMRVEESRRFW
jgi:hypothetical protein